MLRDKLMRKEGRHEGTAGSAALPRETSPEVRHHSGAYPAVDPGDDLPAVYQGKTLNVISLRGRATLTN
jgi:hypothetical protein